MDFRPSSFRPCPAFWGEQMPADPARRCRRHLCRLPVQRAWRKTGYCCSSNRLLLVSHAGRNARHAANDGHGGSRTLKARRRAFTSWRGRKTFEPDSARRGSHIPPLCLLPSPSPKCRDLFTVGSAAQTISAAHLRRAPPSSPPPLRSDGSSCRRPTAVATARRLLDPLHQPTAVDSHPPAHLLRSPGGLCGVRTPGHPDARSARHFQRTASRCFSNFTHGQGSTLRASTTRKPALPPRRVSKSPLLGAPHPFDFRGFGETPIGSEVIQGHDAPTHHGPNGTSSWKVPIRSVPSSPPTLVLRPSQTACLSTCPNFKSSELTGRTASRARPPCGRPSRKPPNPVLTLMAYSMTFHGWPRRR
jgi:hypothetical protein